MQFNQIFGTKQNLYVNIFLHMTFRSESNYYENSSYDFNKFSVSKPAFTYALY